MSFEEIRLCPSQYADQCVSEEPPASALRWVSARSRRASVVDGALHDAQPNRRLLRAHGIEEDLLLDVFPESWIEPSGTAPKTPPRRDRRVQTLGDPWTNSYHLLLALIAVRKAPLGSRWSRQFRSGRSLRKLRTLSYWQSIDKTVSVHQDTKRAHQGVQQPSA